jgi:hypothetical protein
MNYHLFGDKFLEVPNEPDAVFINYYLKNAGTGNARITITDLQGKPVAEVSGPAQAGLNRAQWNMRETPAGGGGRGGAGAAGGRGAGGGGGRGGAGGGFAPSGDYLITIDVAGEKITKTGRIRERIGVR